MIDIDGCNVWDLIVPLFFNDNTELHGVEYQDELLMVLQKQDGEIHHILYGRSLRRDLTPVLYKFTS
jgi:hypothetical protein